MNIFNKWNFLAAGLLCIVGVASARENTGLPLRQDIANRVDAGDCSPASSQIDLNVNNVRARIMNGGDMWWDLVGTAKYEVPKGVAGEPTANSMFASAVWIGGIDQNNQLKVAAQTYRQTGNDFFPGPLDGVGGTTDLGTCNNFDRHWQVLGTEIDQVIAAWEELNAGGASANPIPVDQIPANVLQWPAKGNPYNSVIGQRNMADFYDRDNDGLYDPTMGDYPVIGRSQQCPNTNVFADQMIWWVYNDNGNIHSETGGEPIGMEVQALAFAFRTADEVDNMTFYKYKLINKSANSINQCFMGVWADPDMGCYTDDYIGCDKERGLGIVYNADPVDENCGSGGSYGNQPPLVGIDYFQGPLDENGVELGMSYFLYFNNDFTITGNPENTSDFYGYLSGKWKDGTPFTEGGTAYGGSTPTNYVFPDEPNTTSGWSECSQQNTSADRRIVQSSGPFTLLPGASNDIVVGVVWVRPPVGTYAPCPTFDLLQRADDKAQALFDNCFKILEGPASPDVRIIELDRKLILAIEGYKATEAYSQADPVLRSQGIVDSLYTFEGYQIYQLKNSNVSLQELNDPTNAQLIYQVDIKNGVTKLINYTYDANLGVEVPELRVDGADAGIKHTFEISTNAFATGDKGLINHQTYYFAVLPYAYNGFEQNGEFQKTPYLSARSVRIVTGIPHVTEPEFGGLILNSNYGDGPHVTRQEGKGNGGLPVLLTQESVNSILLNSFEPHPTYERAAGPVRVTVYDPKSVRPGDFQLFLRDSTLASHWKTYRVKDTTICQTQLINTIDSTYGCIDTILGGTLVHIGGVVDTLPTGEIVMVGGYDTIIGGIDTTINCITVQVGGELDTISCASSIIFTDLNDQDPTARDTSLFISKTPTTSNPLTILTDTAYWVLRINDGDSIVSEKTLAEGNEQLLPDWGLSIYIEQVENPQLYSEEPYIIHSSIEFAKPDLTWLGGVADVDAHPILNWIWSGTYATENPELNTHEDWNDGGDPAQFEDPTQQYEVLFGGTVTPFRFASTDLNYGPGQTGATHSQNTLADLPSIDLVFTADKSKWTKSVVVEAGPTASNNEGGVAKGRKRAGRSVDKEGNPVSDATDIGFGWFPGYAIDPETGNRLNIIFAEDSWLIGQNGRDMMWNPTGDYTTPNGEWVLGGRHYIYVMKTKYDEGHVADSLLTANTIVSILNLYKTVGWVAWPLINEGFSFKPVSEGLIPTETTVRIRVKHSYEKFQTVASDPHSMPHYSFGTADLAAIKGDAATAETALDTIKVVPNPYYAYSNYETSALDNRVKIVNLPQKCTISIYSLDGTLIRRYNRDDNTSTSLDWDLKNTAGIPIASGIYIVHIDAGDLGEKTLKWFGVMRPIDLDTF